LPTYSLFEAVGNDKPVAHPTRLGKRGVSHVGWASVYLPTYSLFEAVGNDKPVAHPTRLTELAGPTPLLTKEGQGVVVCKVSQKIASY